MFERMTRLGNCCSFSVDERHIAFSILRKIMDFNRYAGIQLYWAAGLADTSVQAAYIWRDPDNIYVRPPAKLEVRVPAPEQFEYRYGAIMLLVPSIAHELTHRAQLKRMGRFAYWICSIPGLYYPCLDAEAFEAERNAACRLELKQGEYDDFGKGGRG